MENQASEQDIANEQIRIAQTTKVPHQSEHDFELQTEAPVITEVIDDLSNIEAESNTYVRNGKTINQQRFYKVDENGKRHRIKGAPYLEKLRGVMQADIEPVSSGLHESHDMVVNKLIPEAFSSKADHDDEPKTETPQHEADLQYDSEKQVHEMRDQLDQLVEAFVEARDKGATVGMRDIQTKLMSTLDDYSKLKKYTPEQRARIEEELVKILLTPEQYQDFMATEKVRKNVGESKSPEADHDSKTEIVNQDIKLIDDVSPKKTLRERLHARKAAFYNHDIRGLFGSYQEGKERKLVTQRRMLVGVVALAGAGVAAYALTKGVHVPHGGSGGQVAHQARIVVGETSRNHQEANNNVFEQLMRHGDTLWDHGKQILVKQGNKNPSVAQIQQETQRLLDLNNLTWKQVHNLPEGFRFRIL